MKQAKTTEVAPVTTPAMRRRLRISTDRIIGGPSRRARLSAYIVGATLVSLGGFDSAIMVAPAAENHPSGRQTTEQSQIDAANEFAGTWETETTDGGGPTYRETLTLDPVSAETRSKGHAVGHANTQFSMNDEPLSAACDGHWWVTERRHRGASPQATIHVDGANTTNERRCFWDMTILSVSPAQMTVKFQRWSWPYPPKATVTYHRTAPPHPSPNGP
jgi:hypothetical protein